MKPIAITICTYQHPEAVDEILSQTAQYLFNHQVDVYYYDGSSDTKTKEIVNSYREKGFTNLYHFHLPDVPDRSQMAFAGEGMVHEYAYIWPGKDRCMYTEEVVVEILNAISENPDVICLSRNFEYPGIHKIIYNDPATFYRDHAWIATSISEIIFQKKSMLPNFKEWIYPHGVFNSYYSHLFFALTALEEPQICVLSGDHIGMYGSDKAASSWESIVFKVWKDDWIKVNELLPKCYESYKADVIKQTAALPWLIGDVMRLEEFKKNGLLTPEKLPEIEPNWERVSYVPIEIVREIAAGTYDSAHDLRRITPESEFSSMALSLYKMLLNHQIKSSQIPWQSFKEYISGKLYRLNPQKSFCNSLILDAVNDLETFSCEFSDNALQSKYFVQAIISFLLIIDHEKAIRLSTPSELHDMIISIWELVQKGFMPADEIPWENFKNIIYDLIIMLNAAQAPNIPFILGSISDMEQLSLSYAYEPQQIAKYLRVVIALLFLIEK